MDKTELMNFDSRVHPLNDTNEEKSLLGAKRGNIPESQKSHVDQGEPVLITGKTRFQSSPSMTQDGKHFLNNFKDQNDLHFLTIVGKPGIGKSVLLNKLFAEKPGEIQMKSRRVEGQPT